MKKSKYLLIICIFTLIGNVKAGIIEANKYGSYTNSLNARDYSMGDGWITSLMKFGPEDNKGLTVEYSPAISMPVESRSEYIFDEFDNTIGKQEISYTSSYFVDFPANIHLYYNKGNLGLSLGWEPAIQAHWRSENIERDDFYQIVRREERERSIIINALALRAGWKTEDISSRLTVKWLSGSFKRTVNIDSVESEFYHSGSGYNLEAALGYDLGWRIRAIIKGSIGARFETPVNDYRYPYRLGFGLVYRPENQLPAVANLGIQYIPWQKMKVNNIEVEDIKDIIMISGGVEHRLRPDLLLRFGYLWHPLALNKNISRSKFTAGLGYRGSGFSVDLSGSLMNSSFDHGEVSLDYVGDYENQVIEESETRIVLTFTKLFEVK